MKRISSRAVICLCLSLLLILGTAVYTFRFFRNGERWVSYPANKHMYSNGQLDSGIVADRNGTILATCTENGITYHNSASVRKATLHAVGDTGGQIGVGALTRFSGKLSGYNFISGAKPLFSKGRKLYLTLDANVCDTAYRALNGHNGTVGVYNYKTGEILCMVSSPTFDPCYPPTVAEGDHQYDGIYTNRMLSATFIPGSTFKLVTAAAALETIPDILSRPFHCDGSVEVDGGQVTCTTAHGDLTLAQALTVSCNCTFGQLANEMGSTIMNKYVKKTGLTSSYSVNGIQTKPSSFHFEAGLSGELAWSGVGQGKDLVNPCALMVYSGAIANGGSAAEPKIISKTTTYDDLRLSIYLPTFTGKLIKGETARTLSAMMYDNVTNNYGRNNFPGLDICAKSGTSQSDSSGETHAWFTGFLKDEQHPYAFVVYVEGGGSGSKTAGRVANKVLQSAVKNNR